MKKKKIAFLFLICSNLCVHAQQFLNGSFELSSANGCSININNLTFDGLMPHVKAIGGLETLDIFSFSVCSTFSAAQHGNYYSSLENTNDANNSTAFSLALADTLKAGFAYSFCFYDRAYIDPGGPVEIGVSATNSTFGTLVYTSPAQAQAGQWTQRQVSFVSPINATHVTARYKLSSVFSGLFIDNFSFCNITSVGEHVFARAIRTFPNPVENDMQIEMPADIQPPEFLTISDLLGHVVYRESYTEKIDLTWLPPGVYILVADNAQESFFTKFLKQ